MSKNPFNNTFPVDEWENEPCQVEILDKDAETRLAIRDNQATETQIAQLREKVNKRNKGIAVLVDENKGENARIIAENFANITTKLLSNEVIDSIVENVKSGKDFESIAKGLATLNDLIDKQLTRTADKDEAKKGMKNVKIGLAFKDGEIAVAIDGDDNG